MKNLFIITLLFSISLLFFACGQKDEAVQPTSVGTMSATINGVAWSSTETNDASTKFQKIISGQNKKNGMGIVLNIDVASAVTGKVITLNRSNVYEGLTFQQWSSDGNTFIDGEVAANGTITITNSTKTLIEGTFSSKGSQKTITDGKFSLTLDRFF